MQATPYLYFNGRCEEALEFYKQTLDAKVEMIARFKDAPDPGMCNSAPGEKIMHAQFKVGESTVMASDGRCEGMPRFEGFSLSLNAATDGEAERLFAALGEGGQVQMPLTKTFYASRFGMVADKFGMGWMIIVPV